MIELARFPAALVADVLDELGATAQVLPPALQLIVPPASGTLVGRARTLRFRMLPPAERFAAVARDKAAASLRWRDDWGLVANDIVVIGCDGGPHEVAQQGDLVALYYHRLGVVGVLADGYVRDAAELASIGLGVIARGTTPINGRGRLARVGTGDPIDIGGVVVNDGDVIVADGDGCVIVPAALANGELVQKLADAHAAEQASAQMLREGSSLSDMFARHGRL
ncbi:MAG: RraA family protein [Kofleriaceae bacterium]